MQYYEQCVINFETIRWEEIDYYDNHAMISWTETLALRQCVFHHEKYTVLLGMDGKLTAVKRPTIKLIREFGCRLHIPDVTMRFYAKKAAITMACPCVNGEFQLISTLGTCNDNTTWVMGHSIKHHCICPDDGMTDISFVKHIHIKLDLPKGTLAERLAGANRITSIQSAQYEQLAVIHDFGSGKGKGGEYHARDFFLIDGDHEVYQFDAEFFDYRFRKVYAVMHEDTPIVEKDYQRALDKVIRRCYQEKR